VTPDKDGKVFCTTTDTRVLSIVRQEGTVDETCIVPVSLVPNKPGEMKCTNPEDYPTVTSDDKTWERRAVTKGSVSTTSKPLQEGMFPRTHDIIGIAPDDSITLAIDPQLLLNLAQSMGIGVDEERKTITLIIPAPDKHNEITDPVMVHHASGSIGMIMPCAMTTPGAGKLNYSGSQRIKEYNETAEAYKQATTKYPQPKPEIKK